MNETTRLKVLITAHELSPVMGSECGAGWNIVTRIANFHDVTVLYANGSQHGNNNSYKDSVEEYLSEFGVNPGLKFINIEQPGSTKMLASINRMFFNKMGAAGLPMLYYLGYKIWQKKAFKVARELHEKENFHVTHQLTQISFREPGFTWKLGIPFIWGPTGGILTLPKSFQKLLSPKFRILETLRTLSNYYQYNFSKRVIKANKKASVIYAFSNEDARKLKSRASGTVKLMMDSASIIHANSFNRNTSSPPILRGIWCGQLIERKAATILLQALASSEITRNQISFQIVGSGPCDKSLKEQARALNLNNIEWIENVDHETVFKLMSEADLFVHTSIREATSNVIPEALSMGLPVICHDAYGMSIAIDDTCGIKIPFISPQESVKGFHEAIKKLILDRSKLGELKKGAVERSLVISWDNMAREISNDYLSVVRRLISKALN